MIAQTEGGRGFDPNQHVSIMLTLLLLVNTHGISGWPTRKGNPTAKGQKQNWCKEKNTAEKNGKVKFTNSVEFEVKTAEAHWNDVDAIARLALCVTVK